MREEVIISKYLIKNYNLKVISNMYPMDSAELMRVYRMGNAMVRKNILGIILLDCSDVFGMTPSEELYKVVKAYITSLFGVND
jgi:hypothetical protein